MIKAIRRLRSSEVERVLRVGSSLSVGAIRAKVLQSPNTENGGKGSRFAVVVSKKVAGSAVMRNRLRRLAFSLVREIPEPLRAHHIVILVGKRYEEREQLLHDMKALLARV